MFSLAGDDSRPKRGPPVRAAFRDASGPWGPPLLVLAAVPEGSTRHPVRSRDAEDPFLNPTGGGEGETRRLPRTETTSFYCDLRNCGQMSLSQCFALPKGPMKSWPRRL